MLRSVTQFFWTTELQCIIKLKVGENLVKINNFMKIYTIILNIYVSKINIEFH